MAPPKRHKAGPASVPVTQSRDLRQRVFTCVSKLSDRDTHAIAAAELEAIAVELPTSAVPSFISCLHFPDAASAKSPARSHCVRLLALLSRQHGEALASSLPKMLDALLRRFRDPDSAVRAACVDATSAMAAYITATSFSSAFLKPLTTPLFTEQDLNAQTASALCLSAAIDAAPDSEPALLQKFVPKLVKLLKCDSFKAKSALLTLVGSVIGAGGVSTDGALRNLVPCMMEFLSSQDWAARKAVAEAFIKLAVVERYHLSEFKVSCLKTFENRRYDKVKLVRDTMNQMVETWKEIPDVSDDYSPPPRSHSSSKENVSDSRPPPVLRDSRAVDSEAPQMRRKIITASRLPPSDSSLASTARKRTPLQSTNNKTSSAMVGKLGCKKPLDWKVEISVPHALSMTAVCDDDLKVRGGQLLERGETEKNRSAKSEIKRALFGKNPDDKMNRVGGFRSGSRVVPFHDENSESTVMMSNTMEDLRRNHKECEDLSSIRKQLVQIENQQSSLLDLLQRFMGSSQNGLRSLETRVHGLELALDEISFDLAVSTGRMSKPSSRGTGTTCCMLPGAEFLSSKFWRKSQARHSSARFSSSSGTPSVSTLRNAPERNSSLETFKLENRRFQLHRGGGFIMNPLAEIHSESRGLSEASSNKIAKNGHGTT